MNKLFSTDPVLPGNGLAAVRIIIGCFLIYHGWEVFDKDKMHEYIGWDVFRTTFSARFMVYLGKTAELASGFLLAIGLFSRIASVIIMSTFIYIPFVVGSGKIWYEDQYPFLFALFGCMFFFMGPGKWSLDHILFDKKTGR